jgi:hypothetical protein
VRYSALTKAITISKPAGENLPPRWTSIALRFLERAPDPPAMLSDLTASFRPIAGWSGSLASILQSNATLLDQLESLPALSAAVTEQKKQLRKWIKEEQHQEAAFAQQHDERFE